MIPNLEVGLEILDSLWLCCLLLHVGDGGSCSAALLLRDDLLMHSMGSDHTLDHSEKEEDPTERSTVQLGPQSLPRLCR